MLWLVFGTTLLVVVGGYGLLLLKTLKPTFDAREEVAKLKRMVEERDLDWVDMRARCKRLLDRTEKAAAALKPEVESETVPTNGAEGAALTSITGRALTPHQMQIQQQILKRRAGM